MLPNRRRLVLAPLIAGLAPAARAAATAVAAAAVGEPPLLTVLDGEAVLLRGADRLALAEGVALRPDDVIELTAAARLARIEFADGLSATLGPATRVLLAPRIGGESAGAPLYLLTGWLKIGAPPAVAARVLAPAVEVATRGGTLVLSIQPDATTLFVEAGEASLRRRGTEARAVGSGELASLGRGDDAQVELANRPSRAFVAGVPRAFMDPVPARAAKLRGHLVEPRRLGPLAYADAQPWLDAEPRLRQASLPRWRPLAREAEFRRALLADLPAHPEWRPILLPPPPTPTPQSGAYPARKWSP